MRNKPFCALFAGKAIACTTRTVTHKPENSEDSASLPLFPVLSSGCCLKKLLAQDSSHSHSPNMNPQLKMFPNFGHLQRWSKVLQETCKEELLHGMLIQQLVPGKRFSKANCSSAQKSTHTHTNPAYKLMHPCENKLIKAAADLAFQLLVRHHYQAWFKRAQSIVAKTQVRK